MPVLCRGSVSAGGAGGAGICGLVSRGFIEIAEDKWERVGEGSRILMGPLGS